MSANEPKTEAVRISGALSAVLVALVFGALAAGAQGNPPQVIHHRPHMVPVTIALVEGASSQARTVILRRARATPHDIIVLSRDAATPNMLSTALLALLRSREMHGDSVQHDLRLGVTAHASSGSLGPREGRIVRRALDRLRAGQATRVPDVGMAIMTELDLPAQALRDKNRARGKVRFQRSTRGRAP